MVTQQHSGFEATGPITLSGEGLVYIELRPDLDFETIRGNVGIPALVSQGIFRGFSLPVYAADNQELFFTICVLNRWDGVSDIKVHAECWLTQAQAASKKFNLRLDWEHFTPGVDVIPATSNQVPVQTETGIVAQFKSYKVEFTIDYDIDTPDNIVADDQLAIRLIRIDADPIGDEIGGEVVIHHVGVIFRRDKLGVATP